MFTIRLVAVAFISFLAATASYSQSFYGGLSVGRLHSNKIFETQSENQSEKNLPIATFQAGLHFGMQLNKKWSLETKLQYSDEGHKTRYNYLSTHAMPNDYISYEMLYRQQYLRIPLHVIYTVRPKNSRFGFSVYAGPSVGVLINQSFNVKALNPLGQDMINRADMAGYANQKKDFGFNLGARAQCNFKNGHAIFLEVGYYQGFQHAAKHPIYPNYTNRNFNVSLGYTIPLFK